MKKINEYENQDYSYKAFYDFLRIQFLSEQVFILYQSNLKCYIADFFYSKFFKSTKILQFDKVLNNYVK